MEGKCAAKFCSLINSSLLSHSSFQSLQTIPCKFCSCQLYCSRKCRDIDWEIEHSKKCSMENFSNDNRATRKIMFRGGKKLCDYEIMTEKCKNGVEREKILGEGSFGCVKLARNIETEKLYALKIMSKQKLFEFSLVHNIKREIKIQRRLDHPHIIKLYRFFEDKENAYLVLEYASKGNLAAYLKTRKTLPENQAFIFFIQMCLGIDYLHKLNILHRDLKPGNLLLDSNGCIKVCDFGWSIQDIQLNNSLCGTLAYMPPEVISRGKQDEKVDIYSLGVILFEMIEGKKEGFLNMNAENTSISEDLKDLIEKMTAADPIKRINMEGIWEHNWVKKYEGVHRLSVKSYVFEERIDEIANDYTTEVTDSKMTEAKLTSATEMSFPLMDNKKNPFLFDLPFQNEETPKKLRPTNSLLLTKSEFQKMMDNDETPKSNFKNNLAIPKLKYFASENSKIKDYFERKSEKMQSPSHFLDKVISVFGCLSKK